MFAGLGKLPSHFKPNLQTSAEFPHGFSFHLQTKFSRGFPPPTIAIPGIPHGIHEILPAGLFVFAFILQIKKLTITFHESHTTSLAIVLTLHVRSDASRC